jgi:uncharacterized RDD family membrane protein YckC
MKNIVTIQTPEYVQIPFETAGLATRALAKLLDFVCLAFILIPLGIISMLASGMADNPQQGWSSFVGAIIIFLTAATPILYFTCLEYWMKGQTIGKKVMGIRVIHDNGERVSFPAVFLRNLMQIADMFPGFYLAGMLSIFFHRQEKRLGDMVAGTLVVMERKGEREELFFRFAKLDFLPQELEILKKLASISADRYRLLESFLLRRSTLRAEIRQYLADQMMKKWWPEIETKPGHEEEFLEKVYLYLRQTFYPADRPKIIPALQHRFEKNRNGGE